MLELIEPEDAAVREFETRPTTYRRVVPALPTPSRREHSTLDAVIAELLAASGC